MHDVVRVNNSLNLPEQFTIGTCQCQEAWILSEPEHHCTVLFQKLMVQCLIDALQMEHVLFFLVKGTGNKNNKGKEKLASVIKGQDSEHVGRLCLFPCKLPHKLLQFKNCLGLRIDEPAGKPHCLAHGRFFTGFGMNALDKV